MIEAFKQLRRATRDKVLGFILLRCDLPETLVAFVNEIGKELKQ